MTISGMLLAVCFLCLSRAKPLDALPPNRPASTIFTFYSILSILGQFGVHLWAMMHIQHVALRWSFPCKLADDAEFSPSLMNSGIYLISLLMQVGTFAVNYQGRPYRESLMENAGLFKSLLAVGAVAWIAALEVMPEFNTWLQIVSFPPEFKTTLLMVMTLDLVLCYLIEYVLSKALGQERPKWRK